MLDRDHAVTLFTGPRGMLECDLDGAVIGFGSAVGEEHAFQLVTGRARDPACER